MKKKLKFFGLFSHKQANIPPNNTFSSYIQNQNDHSPPPDPHFNMKLPSPSLFKPGGDVNLSDPGNDSNPDSFFRLKGFSMVAEDVGSEQKYKEIQLSVAVNKRQEKFKDVTQELVNYQPNLLIGGLNDSDKSKTKEPLVELDKANKNGDIININGDEKNNDVRKSKLNGEIIKENNEKKGKISLKCFEIKSMLIKQADWLKNRTQGIIKHILICYFLTLNCSVYGEIWVGFYTTPLLAFLLSNLMFKLFEEVIKETQYTGLLKELQVFRIDKERKNYVSENMKLDNIDDLEFCRKVCQIGSFFMGLLVFPLIMTRLYSFAVILQCLIIWIYFLIISLLFRFKNNKRVQNYRIRERAASDSKINEQSRLALKDLSSSYLRFLADFEKTKGKIMEKTNQNRENISSKFSSYLTKKTLEVGLQRMKLFNLSYTPLIESFMSFLLLMLLLYSNYLMIFAFQNTNLAPLLAILLIFLFLLFRQIMRYVFERYFLSQKLYKMFRALISFTVLFPYKLMFFIIPSYNSGDIHDVFIQMVVLFMIKTSLKIGAFIVMGLVLFKVRAYLYQKEQNQVSHRKNRRKKDKAPESLAAASSQYFFGNSNKDSMEEYLDKRSKEFCLSFFLFNFCDLLLTLLIFVGCVTLHYIPRTRWYYLRDEVFSGYLRYVGLDFGLDIFVDFLLFLVLKKFSVVFKRRGWMRDGLKFLKKRGEIFYVGLYFLLFINFYCFELFFLMPFKS